MASIELHDSFGSDAARQRARRIPDGEWDVWRETIEKLYREDDMSRKEIIETMEKDHGFTIT